VFSTILLSNAPEVKLYESRKSD